MSLVTVLLFALGLALLIAGAELLVRGASRLAAAAGVSPLVVGLTVVALGTSAPELAVGVRSALAGQADLAVGNVVGSNILNVLLILGMAALIAPLAVAQQLVRLDVPLMIGVSLLLWALAADGALGRADGALLVLGGVLYTLFSVVQSRKESSRAVREEYAEEFAVTGRQRQSHGYLALQLLLIAAGLALLVLGAGWLVGGAVAFARLLGVGELVIGLTVVAVGTSLPEIAATVTASLKGERDIAVGNVIGSNLLNILVVLGITTSVAPGGVPIPSGALAFDIPVMTAVAAACLPVFFIGGRISRWEGALFLGYYAAYTAYLLLNAGRHALLPAFGAAMAWFALPLTAVTLLVLAARAARAAQTGRPAGGDQAEPGPGLVEAREEKEEERA